MEEKVAHQSFTGIKFHLDCTFSSVFDISVKVPQKCTKLRYIKIIQLVQNAWIILQTSFMPFLKNCHH